MTANLFLQHNGHPAGMATSTTVGLAYLAASCAATYVLAIWIVPAIFRLLEWWEKRRKLIEAGEKIPGPRAWPLIGNTIDLYQFDFGRFTTKISFG